VSGFEGDVPAVEVFVGGRLRVRAAQCGACLFSKDRLVGGSRAREIVTETRAQSGGSFICHRGQVSDEPNSICAVWWDRYSDDDWIFRYAKRLGIVERVG
jgi:hypothetical protein